MFLALTNGDSTSTLHRDGGSPTTTALLRRLVEKAIGETDSLSSSNNHQQNNCELIEEGLIHINADYLGASRSSLLSGMNNQVSVILLLKMRVFLLALSLLFIFQFAV